MASVVVNGDTSGAVTLSAPAVAGTVTVTLPSASGTMASLASVTANGVTYVNSSSQPTTGSALTWDGSLLSTTVADNTVGVKFKATTSNIRFLPQDGGAAKIAALNAAESAFYPLITQGSSLQYVIDTTEGMRLTSTGLGIGTTSPSTKLHVVGSGNPTITLAGSDGAYSSIFNMNSSSGGVSEIAASQVLKLSTNGSERARIDSSGNLLVGTTTPVFNTAGRGLITINGSSAAALGFTAGAVDKGIILHTGTDMIMSNSVSGAITFQTNNTERARIDSSGNLLVGTTSSFSARLAVKDSTSNGTTSPIVCKNSSDTGLFSISSNGYFVTGTGANSPYNLTTASGSNVTIESDGVLKRSTSSLKYKTDVQDTTHGLAEVLQLRPVTYKGKNDGNKIFGGLIAEEVDAAGLTEFVQYAEDGSPDALAYGNMVSLLTKAIQEQQALITQLTARITALESA